MIWVKGLGIILLVVYAISGLAESKTHPNREMKYCSVVKAGYRFSFLLYNDLVKKGAENLIFSPYSISSITAMLMLGAGGDTERELRTFLQYGVCNPDMARIHQSHRAVREYIENQSPEVTLTVADRIFPSNRFPMRQNYTQKAEYYYGSAVQNLDYARNPEGSRVVINDWIEQKTNGVLKDMMPPGSINTMTEVVLANAIYFKGTWKTKFNPRITADAKFYVDANTVVTTPFMSNKAYYNYATNDVFSVIELPYNGEAASMMIVLPKKRFGLQYIEKSFSGGLLNGLLQYVKRKQVVVRIPKFRLDYDAELDQSYKDLGAQTMFDSRADFSAMTERPGMFISSVYHKAFIDVNEDGTEAAAATVMSGTRSLTFAETFTCDHPFLFYIVHKPTKSILFLGRYVKPT